MEVNVPVKNNCALNIRVTIRNARDLLVLMGNALNLAMEKANVN